MKQVGRVANSCQPAADCQSAPTRIFRPRLSFGQSPPTHIARPLRYIQAMRVLSLVFVCLTGFLAIGQTTKIDIPYQKFVLDNGLTVIVHEDHKAPIVAVNMWYDVGSKNEKTGKTGF